MSDHVTFIEILKTVYRTYQIDACFVADHLELEDEVVESWERGETKPTSEQLKKFSAAFVIPLKILEDSLKAN